MLTRFVKQPAVRTLFALRRVAKVRFYETAVEGGDAVGQIYAVTYPDEQNRPTSFFIELIMQRSVDSRQRPGGLDPLQGRWRRSPAKDGSGGVVALNHKTQAGQDSKATDGDPAH